MTDGESGIYLIIHLLYLLILKSANSCSLAWPACLVLFV